MTILLWIKLFITFIILFGMKMSNFLKIYFFLLHHILCSYFYLSGCNARHHHGQNITDLGTNYEDKNQKSPYKRKNRKKLKTIFIIFRSLKRKRPSRVFMARTRWLTSLNPWLRNAVYTPYSNIIMHIHNVKLVCF